eukprot:jgi/Mesen1/8768/ME000524S08075
MARVIYEASSSATENPRQPQWWLEARQPGVTLSSDDCAPLVKLRKTGYFAGEKTYKQLEERCLLEAWLLKERCRLEAENPEENDDGVAQLGTNPERPLEGLRETDDARAEQVGREDQRNASALLPVAAQENVGQPLSGACNSVPLPPPTEAEPLPHVEHEVPRTPEDWRETLREIGACALDACELSDDEHADWIGALMRSEEAGGGVPVEPAPREGPRSSINLYLNSQQASAGPAPAAAVDDREHLHEHRGLEATTGHTAEAPAPAPAAAKSLAERTFDRLLLEKIWKSQGEGGGEGSPLWAGSEEGEVSGAGSDHFAASGRESPAGVNAAQAQKSRGQGGLGGPSRAGPPETAMAGALRLQERPPALMQPWLYEHRQGQGQWEQSVLLPGARGEAGAGTGAGGAGGASEEGAVGARSEFEPQTQMQEKKLQEWQDAAAALLPEAGVGAERAALEERPTAGAPQEPQLVGIQGLGKHKEPPEEVGPGLGGEAMAGPSVEPEEQREPREPPLPSPRPAAGALMFCFDATTYRKVHGLLAPARKAPPLTEKPPKPDVAPAGIRERESARDACTSEGPGDAAAAAGKEVLGGQGGEKARGPQAKLPSGAQGGTGMAPGLKRKHVDGEGGRGGTVGEDVDTPGLRRRPAPAAGGDAPRKMGTLTPKEEKEEKEKGLLPPCEVPRLTSGGSRKLSSLVGPAAADARERSSLGRRAPAVQRVMMTLEALNQQRAPADLSTQRAEGVSNGRQLEVDSAQASKVRAAETGDGTPGDVGRAEGSSRADTRRLLERLAGVKRGTSGVEDGGRRKSLREALAEDSSEEEEEEENDDNNGTCPDSDSLCAICDDGGDLLPCQGPCLRSFHATKESVADNASKCPSLGLSQFEVKAMDKYVCPNCEFQQHTCAICHKLGCSADDDSARPQEVYMCARALCGRFYHPPCVARLLCRGASPDPAAGARQLVARIEGGKQFVCPAHTCRKCGEGAGTDEGNFSRQLVHCRRCPKVFHVGCLPSGLPVDNSDPERPQLVWGVNDNEAEDGLPLIMYCKKHELDPELATPARTHINLSVPPGKRKGSRGRAHQHALKAGLADDGTAELDPEEEEAAAEDGAYDMSWSPGKENEWEPDMELEPGLEAEEPELESILEPEMEPGPSVKPSLEPGVEPEPSSEPCLEPETEQARANSGAALGGVRARRARAAPRETLASPRVRAPKPGLRGGRPAPGQARAGPATRTAGSGPGGVRAQAAAPAPPSSGALVAPHQRRGPPGPSLGAAAAAAGPAPGLQSKSPGVAPAAQGRVGLGWGRGVRSGAGAGARAASDAKRPAGGQGGGAAPLVQLARSVGQEEKPVAAATPGTPSRAQQEKMKARLLKIVQESQKEVTDATVTASLKVPSNYSRPTAWQHRQLMPVGRIESILNAMNKAIKCVEETRRVEEALMICPKAYVNELSKLHNHLRVYLAPFLHGVRYTSYGRHFTQSQKLKELVDVLHPYVKDGDAIVDFCCGANDFSRLCHERLVAEGKLNCAFKNFDIMQPKHSFQFEKKDWLKTTWHDLPEGRDLIIGLNPPYGVNACLANQFIRHALTFSPVMIVLIVPDETMRLEEFGYDLLLHNKEMFKEKAFYLPGSSTRQGEENSAQWNKYPPPLFIWIQKHLKSFYIPIALDQNYNMSFTVAPAQLLRNPPPGPHVGPPREEMLPPGAFPNGPFPVHPAVHPGEHPHGDAGGMYRLPQEGPPHAQVQVQMQMHGQGHGLGQQLALHHPPGFYQGQPVGLLQQQQHHHHHHHQQQLWPQQQQQQEHEHEQHEQRMMMMMPPQHPPGEGQSALSDKREGFVQGLQRW